MEGSTVTIPEGVHLKLLPGASLNVAKGADLIVSSNAALFYIIRLAHMRSVFLIYGKMSRIL